MPGHYGRVILADMRIRPAQVTESGDALTIRYPFEIGTRPELSGVLWFRVAGRLRTWVMPTPEPAVASLVLLAMRLGETIEVEEPISARFYYGLHRFGQHFDLWYPGLFEVPSIRAPLLEREAPTTRREVTACFSGGVDSFHTLFDHVGAGAPCEPYRLTSLFFAHGFDLPLSNPSYDGLAREYEAVGLRHGLSFVRLATNVRDLLDPHVDWVIAHGACMIGCALLLSAGIGKFLIPSTNRHSLVFSPCGSNPVTDPMLGTESLEIVHHGTHLSRIQKIMSICDQPEAQQHLRVCWQNIPDCKNCGRCVKCLKTMMPLAVAGKLASFPVFPPLPPWPDIDPACFAPLDLSRCACELSYTDELKALARKFGRDVRIP